MYKSRYHTQRLEILSLFHKIPITILAVLSFLLKLILSLCMP